MMDIIEKGKRLAQDGKYEEALDTLATALKNDKNNPDLHFYLGLCYSSIEEFAYAKYHYEIALTLKPDHDKTNMVFGSLIDVDAAKPPERLLSIQTKENVRPPENAEYAIKNKAKEPPHKKLNPKLNLSEKKWEEAFPDNLIIAEEKSNLLWKMIFMVIGIAIVASIVYYGLNYFA